MAKKTKISRYERLPAVRLYREELEDIFALFPDISENVKIETTGVEYESPEDFFTENKDKESVAGLVIRGQVETGRIHIQFDDDAVSVFTSNQSGLAGAAYGRIKEILKNNKVRASFLTRSLIGMLTSLLIVATVASFITYIAFFVGWEIALETDDSMSIVKVAELYILVCCTLSLSGCYLFYKAVGHLTKTNICPAPRSQQKSFWARNRDQMIWDVIKIIRPFALGFTSARLFD